MPSDIDTQIRKLPYGVLKGLEEILDPDGDKDWRALISVMPGGRYTKSQVDLIRHRGSGYGKSSTSILLQDMCQRCVTLRELGHYLKKIENYEALRALDWPPEPVIIKTQPECAILQEGGTLCLTVEAIGYPPPSYQWYKNDMEIPGEELNELRITRVTTAASGTYKCIINNVENAVCSDEVKVLVSKVPETAPNKEPPPVNSKPVIIMHPTSSHVLPGQRHALQCQATGDRPMAYAWYKNGQPLLNTNSPSLDFPAFDEENIGRYCCKVSNADGADISEEAELALERVDRPRNVASDKVALMIGNQDYTAAFHEALQGQGRLQHTIADTKTLGSLLHSDDMGFNVLSLGNLTRHEMVKGIGEYVNLLSEDCYAFFYYAGHGFEVNGKHYLVPVDAPADWKQEDAICIQWVLELIWKARPKLTVIILDMCRVRPNTTGRASFEDYDFPTDLKIVFGFATCSQSESYERVNEDNGIYMKHFQKHICRDVKIEDILHDVTTDVEQDTSVCVYTKRQRPEYVSTGGGNYSLRDPVVSYRNRSAERWLEAHKLPEKRTIEFEDGIKVEVRFEHSDWLSNSVNIFIAVVDPGVFDNCYAYIYQLPNELEEHFPPECQNIIVEPEDRHPHENPDILPRSLPQPAAYPTTPSAHTPACERLTGMFHLQRLHNNVTVTIALECESHDVPKSKKYKVVVFSESEFGLAKVFGNDAW